MTRALAALIILVSVAAVALGGRDDKASAEPSSRDEVQAETRAFAELFFTDAHIAECVGALDSLRQRGRRHVYQSYSEVLESDAPEAKTSSGILMLYTVVSRSDTLYHHFSVSRAPFLATAFGQTLVGLACLRLDLPAPKTILVSPRQVFHAEWHLTPQEHAELVGRELPPWPEPISAVAADALVLTTDSEMVPYHVDYDEVRRIKGESSN
jgi:hypothetical protein